LSTNGIQEVARSIRVSSTNKIKVSFLKHHQAAALAFGR